MSTFLADPSSALNAYEALASHYDLFTTGYEHDRWCERLLGLARTHGLEGLRHLDVACGTGKSFEPFLTRGFQTTACDLSPSMVQIARTRAGGRARVLVADMRALPAMGPFDLVTCLDDALNYLLDDAELIAALTGMGRCLAPAGLLVFDVNTLLTYREVYAGQFERRLDRTSFRWRGEPGTAEAPGGLFAATLEVAGESAPGGSNSRHVQRHHPPAAVLGACAAAGLRPLGVWGQHPGARLEQPADELRHAKSVWLVARAPAVPAPPSEGRQT